MHFTANNNIGLCWKIIKYVQGICLFSHTFIYTAQKYYELRTNFVAFFANQLNCCTT